MLHAESNMRAIVINYNLYIASNKEVEGLTDPGGQIAWLLNILYAAEQQGEKVLIDTLDLIRN